MSSSIGRAIKYRNHFEVANRGIGIVDPRQGIVTVAESDKKYQGFVSPEIFRLGGYKGIPTQTF